MKSLFDHLTYKNGIIKKMIKIITEGYIGYIQRLVSHELCTIEFSIDKQDINIYKRKILFLPVISLFCITSLRVKKNLGSLHFTVSLSLFTQYSCKNYFMGIWGTGQEPSQFSIGKSGKALLRWETGCIFENEKALKM